MNSDVAVSFMTKTAVLGVLGAAMTGVTGKLTCVDHACGEGGGGKGTWGGAGARARPWHALDCAMGTAIHAPWPPSGC